MELGVVGGNPNFGWDVPQYGRAAEPRQINEMDGSVTMCAGRYFGIDPRIQAW
jgi:hypothetical protein